VFPHRNDNVTPLKRVLPSDWFYWSQRVHNHWVLLCTSGNSRFLLQNNHACRFAYNKWGLDI